MDRFRTVIQTCIGFANTTITKLGVVFKIYDDPESQMRGRVEYIYIYMYTYDDDDEPNAI